MLVLSKLLKARRANHLTLEFGKILAAAAEQTGIFILFEYNFVSVNIDFNGVRATYIHFGTHLLWNNYASKLVNTSNNTGGFQLLANLS